jgi:hypothetical protein
VALGRSVAVLVDKKSIPWIVVALIGFVVATALYFPYAHSQPKGATGGSWQGITYGIVGTAFMAFAMLLALRKRLRTWRIGRVYTWTQGHVWLALLSYPIILYHAGWHWGQAWNLTWVMMWIFTIVIVSGIVGLILQNIIPTKMLYEVQLETIYDQIDHVINQLGEEAENIVINASTAAEDSAQAEVGGGVAVEAPAVLASSQKRLAEFYAAQIKPYMASESGKGFILANPSGSRAAFDDLTRALPPTMRRAVNVPLSYALTVLAIVHIVVALRYR